MVLISLGGAWVAGILVGTLGWMAWPWLCLGLLPLPLLYFPGWRRPVILASVGLLCFISGALCYQASQPAADAGSLLYYNGRGLLTVRGMVSEDPETGDKTVRFKLGATAVLTEGVWQPVSGTALLTVSRYQEYQYGDIIESTGRLEAPQSLSGFDYPGYLANQDIYSTMAFPRTEVIRPGQGIWLKERIYRLRHDLAAVLERALPEPQAALAQGVTLGLRSHIPDSLNEAFARTGTAHILAISGMNISIVAGILAGLGRRLWGRRHYIYVWLALAAVWFYALLAGMEAPVMRSAIMATVFLAAELLGRQKSGATALVLAAAVMAGLDPRVLWSASFQLSFLAMAGLMLFGPYLKDQGERAIQATLGGAGIWAYLARLVNDALMVTVAALLAVWPLTAYYFGMVSLVGLPATLLTLPALPAIMVTTALTGILGLIYMPLAYVSGWLAWLCLAYLNVMVNWFAAVPGAALDFRANGTVLLWGYYGGLTAGWAVLRRWGWLREIWRPRGAVRG
jgi:competence protein ComEC